MEQTKIYSIKINGIDKSISEVDSLLKQLDNLEKRLGKLGGSELNVASKEQSQLMKEQLKNAELLTEEGRKRASELEKIKAENKEIIQQQKEIAQGVRDESGAYTNTLAGKRAELAAMKKELSSMNMGDTDGWNAQRDAVARLNQEIKELEQSYGVFTRDVGNYQKATAGLAAIASEANKAENAIDGAVASVEQLRGKQLFQVDISGQVVQFENLSQAISEIDDLAQKASAEMLALAQAGKENTEEYQRLNAEFTEFVNKAAELERARKYSDELKDTLSSTSRELDLAVNAFESLTSVMQIGSGIAGLFGQDQEEINKAMNRTVQLMGILQAAQTLYNNTKKAGTLQNKLWTASLRGASKAMNAMTISTKLSVGAMKALKVAIASTGIGLLVVALGALVNWMDKLITKAREEKNAMYDANEELERRQEILDSFRQRKVDLGLITEAEAAKEAYADARAELEMWLRDLKRMKIYITSSSSSKSDKPLLEDEEALSGVEMQLQKRIDDLNSALEGSNKRETKKIKELIFAYEGLKNAVTRYLDALVQKKKADEKSIKDDDKAAEEIKRAAEEYAKKVSDANNQIRELEIDAIKDNRKKALAELKKTYDDQLKVVRERGIKVKELELLLTEQYNNAILATEKKFADERREVILSQYADLFESNLNVKNKSLESSIQLLEEQEKIINRMAENTQTVSPLGDFRQWSTDDNILENLINNLSLIEITVDGYSDEAKRLARAMRDLYLAQDVKQYEKGTRKSFADILSSGLNDIESVVGELDGVGADVKAEMEDIINYYTSILTMDMDEPAFTEGLKPMMERVEKVLAGYFDKTDEMSDSERDTLKALLAIWKNFTNERSALQQELANRTVAIENDYTDRLVEINNDAADKMIEGYRNQFDELESLRAAFAEGIMTGDYDLDMIGNIAVQIQAVKKFSNEYQVLGGHIQKETEKVIKEFNRLVKELDDVNDEMAEFLKNINGEYSLDLDLSMDESELTAKLSELGGTILEDWKKLVEKKGKLQAGIVDVDSTKSQLESLGDIVKKALDGVEMNGREWAAAISKLVQAAVSMVTASAQQIVDVQYQNAMYLIEQERKEIDEQLDIMQDAYDKQEAITEAHNEKIQSLEDELSTARGDRRMFLLDEINSEMAKREESYQQQVKLQKLQEQLENRRDQLEKKGDAAEKKRNKANQKIQLAQAIANTAVAVTNALSVQPWALGVALAAIASALGAVQIGTIAAQKFASGGVIQGASHASGGVKVLGGTAEVEGGEYITNKRTTAKNLGLLQYINASDKTLDLDDIMQYYAHPTSSYSTRKFRFADGGQLPSMSARELDVKGIASGMKQDDRPIYVSVTEIENVSKRVRNVKALAGYND